MTVTITGKTIERQEEVLTDTALALIELLHRDLNPKRLALLEARKNRIADIASGKELNFLDSTKSIREDVTWQVASGLFVIDTIRGTDFATRNNLMALKVAQLALTTKSLYQQWVRWASIT